jgi:hypothetical protein
MKKQLLLLGLILLNFTINAQKKDSIRVDTLNPNFVSPSETAKFPFLNIIPPSSEAAAFARISELPVSLGSGTTSFPIPVHDIVAGSLKVSVSLENHSSGIKVMDVSNTVGTNWTLKGAGVSLRGLFGVFQMNTNTVSEMLMSRLNSLVLTLITNL